MVQMKPIQNQSSTIGLLKLMSLGWKKRYIVYKNPTTRNDTFLIENFNPNLYNNSSTIGVKNINDIWPDSESSPWLLIYSFFLGKSMLLMLDKYSNTDMPINNVTEATAKYNIFFLTNFIFKRWVRLQIRQTHQKLSTHFV